MAPSVELRVLDDLRENVSDDDKRKPPLRFNTMNPTDFLHPPDYSIEQTVAAIAGLARGARISELTIVCHRGGNLL